jgi:hypothetical protein
VQRGFIPRLVPVTSPPEGGNRLVFVIPRGPVLIYVVSLSHAFAISIDKPFLVDRARVNRKFVTCFFRDIERSCWSACVRSSFSFALMRLGDPAITRVCMFCCS